MFFRQADACIITRHGFDVMGELNPQVKRQLRVLAASKPMVANVVLFPARFFRAAQAAGGQGRGQVAGQARLRTGHDPVQVRWHFRTAGRRVGQRAGVAGHAPAAVRRDQHGEVRDGRSNRRSIAVNRERQQMRIRLAVLLCASDRLSGATNGGLSQMRSRVAVLFAVLLTLGAGRARAAEAAGLLQGGFGVGLTQSCFLNVNRNDAEAAFKSFMRTVGVNRGYHLQTETHVFDDTAAFEKAIKAGRIQLAILNAWQFLTMDIHDHVKPFFVPTERGQVGKRHVLLTRRGSGFDTLASLRGQGLTRLEIANASLGRYWLETLLLAGPGGTPESFFGPIESASKPTAVVLPVFFGKKPCCLVDQFSFEVMAELNPQVGRQLQAVATSDPYVDVIICLANEGFVGSRGKEDTIAGLRDLHQEAAGQQILMLFKIGPLIPFEESQFKEVRALHAQYERLRKEARP